MLPFFFSSSSYETQSRSSFSDQNPELKNHPKKKKKTDTKGPNPQVWRDPIQKLRYQFSGIIVIVELSYIVVVKGVLV